MNAPERIWADQLGFATKGGQRFQMGRWIADETVAHPWAYILDTPEALAKSPAVIALVKAAVEAERERCARLVEKRAEDYDRDFGIYDHSTGVTEYPGTGSESMEEWESIAAAIRAEVPE